MKRDLGLFIFLSAVFIAAVAILGYEIPRDATFPLLSLYWTIFGAGFCLFRIAQKERIPISYFLLVGGISRVVLLFSWPQLSDDFYRFFWDGYLVSKGISPYADLPSHLISRTEDAVLLEIFPHLNSPDYFSVYPPLNQAVFALSVWLGGQSLFGTVIALRAILIGGEVITAWVMKSLLQKLGFHASKILLYVLNPLVIFEITGNLHFEGLMLLFILLTFIAIYSRIAISGAWFSLAVSAKLTPFVLFPLFIIKQYKSHSQILFIIVFSITLLLVNFPVFKYRSNFLSSIQLYFGTFEFNASIYYLVREISMLWIDYNPIAYLSPTLTVIAMVLILVITVQKMSSMTIMERAVSIYMVYLLFHTTVHPWYCIIPLGLSLFTRYRHVLVWSMLIVLSYVGYRSLPVTEPYWLLCVEYTTLLIFMWKDFKKYHFTKTMSKLSGLQGDSQRSQTL